jgi:hypothetical protein
LQSKVETTDIFRGAFFLSKGGRLTEAHLSEDSRQIVSFLIIGEDLPELDRDYRDGKAMVNPLQLRESLNLLRDVLFKTKRENERKKEMNDEHIKRGDRGRQRV